MCRRFGADNPRGRPANRRSRYGQRHGPPDVVTVRNITRVELTPGLPIVDDSGTLIGTVERRAGNTIVISDGKTRYKVPITQLYAFRRGAADQFASRLPKAVLEPIP